MGIDGNGLSSVCICYIIADGINSLQYVARKNIMAKHGTIYSVCNPFQVFPNETGYSMRRDVKWDLI